MVVISEEERKSMTKHFRRELDTIKRNLLQLGTMVEEHVQMALKAIEDVDAGLSEKIIKTDYEIDEMEVEIEEECLKALALYQPVAVDLRFIIAVIKINNELERIGDQAVNIAERIITIAKRSGPYEVYFDYAAMGAKTQKMLKLSLDALVNMDVDIAYKVVTLDDEVDKIKREAYDDIKEAMKQHSDKIGYLINVLLISRHLERLADHAVNIAEEVIYLIEGEIIRHAEY